VPGPPALLVDLGRALQSLRTDRRLSQEELGLRTGVHRNYIGGIERGERRPSVMTIAKLAKGLDVQTWELLRVAEESGDDPA
jgi:transcriptional regulator with XRE-family HTH domain